MGQLFIPTSGRTAGRFSTGQRLLKMLIKTIKVKVVGMMMTVFDLDDGGFIEVDFWQSMYRNAMLKYH